MFGNFKEAFVYFNYFVHDADMKSIVKKLIGAAEEAVEKTISDANDRYKKYCELSKKEYKPISNEWSVMTYDELYMQAEKKCNNLENILADDTKKYLVEKLDKREIPIKLIRKMTALAGIYHPVIVLYFAAPYCPHNTLKETDDKTFSKIKMVVKETEDETGLSYDICRFFPSLSDSSYLAIDDKEESTKMLERNFPQMEQLYPLPFEKMRNLNIKAVNYGVYGKDAHKWTERLYVPYSFGVLPKLILKTLDKFL